MNLLEQVAAALSEQGTIDELVERTSLTKKQVMNTTQRLHAADRAHTTDGHWTLHEPGTTGAAPLSAALNARTRGESKRRGRGSKGGAKRARKSAQRVVAPAKPERVLSFFLDEDFDLQVMRRDGEGEAAIVYRADLEALAAFLAATQRMWST